MLLLYANHWLNHKTPGLYEVVLDTWAGTIKGRPNYYVGDDSQAFEYVFLLEKTRQETLDIVGTLLTLLIKQHNKHCCLTTSVRKSMISSTCDVRRYGSHQEGQDLHEKAIIALTNYFIPKKNTAFEEPWPVQTGYTECWRAKCVPLHMAQTTSYNVWVCQRRSQDQITHNPPLHFVEIKEKSPQQTGYNLTDSARTRQNPWQDWLKEDD